MDYLPVGYRVVDLKVDYIMQRRDFRELGIESIEHRLDCGQIVAAGDSHNHNLSGRSNTYHQGTHKSMLCPEVVERQIVFLAVFFHEETYSVAEVVLEMTLLYIEDFVECTGYMESGSIAVGKFFAGAHLFECEPAAVGKSIFHLVAVAVDCL